MNDVHEVAGTPSERPLTQGLARNTVFNLLGWLWPIGLSLVTLPYILSQLGTDAYGIFALTSVVAGYLGFLNGPVAMGSVRFLAEAYARKQWSDFRSIALAGIAIIGPLSLLGGLLMFLAADWLATKVFAISAAHIQSSVTAFRLAALSFVLNGLDGAVQSIPAAMRRYDILNQAKLIIGSLNTGAIILALWWGWGLPGALVAQVFSSALALGLFIAVGWWLLRNLPGDRRTLPSMTFIKRLAPFSSLLFAGNIASQVGLQIDRTLVGVLLGTSAMAYYSVPTRITDKIPGMMLMFCTALYPLSSEAVATGRTTELRELYHDMVRRLLWLSALIATPLMALSKDLLGLWIGPEFMVSSWFVLSLLAAGTVWRSTGSVAYHVCTGMGRAGLSLIASIGTAVFMIVPVYVMTRLWGAPGTALGACLGLFVTNLAFDVVTQRRLLGVQRWRESLMPYARTALAQAGVIIVYQLLSPQVSGWAGLFLKAFLVVGLYTGISMLTGSLVFRDVRFVTSRISHAVLSVRGAASHE